MRRDSNTKPFFAPSVDAQPNVGCDKYHRSHPCAWALRSAPPLPRAVILAQPPRIVIPPPRPGAPSIAPLSHAMGGMYTARTTSPCRCLFSVVVCFTLLLSRRTPTKFVPPQPPTPSHQNPAHSSKLIAHSSYKKNRRFIPSKTPANPCVKTLEVQKSH
jgi:hypothetical protein